MSLWAVTLLLNPTIGRALTQCLRGESRAGKAWAAQQWSSRACSIQPSFGCAVLSCAAVLLLGVCVVLWLATEARIQPTHLML